MKRERFTYIHQEGEPLRERRTAAAADRPAFAVVEGERVPEDAIPYTLTEKAIAYLADPENDARIRMPRIPCDAGSRFYAPLRAAWAARGGS